MSIFGFSGGNLLRLAKRDSRLAARGSGSQARKIASPRNEYSAHTQKIGQSSRSLPQARRIVGSGDENVTYRSHSLSSPREEFLLKNISRLFRILLILVVSLPFSHSTTEHHSTTSPKIERKRKKNLSVLSDTLKV